MRSDGTIPRKPVSGAGLGNRRKSPTSAATPAADSVSIPRKAQPGDHLGVRALGDLLLERGDQCLAAAGEQLDRGQVVSEACPRARVLEAELTEPETVVGVLFIALIGNGYDLLGLDPLYEQITLGGLMILAVGLDAWSRGSAG